MACTCMPVHADNSNCLPSEDTLVKARMCKHISNCWCKWPRAEGQANSEISKLASESECKLLPLK